MTYNVYDVHCDGSEIVDCTYMCIHRLCSRLKTQRGGNTCPTHTTYIHIACILGTMAPTPWPYRNVPYSLGRLGGGRVRGGDSICPQTEAVHGLSHMILVARRPLRWPLTVECGGGCCYVAGCWWSSRRWLLLCCYVAGCRWSLMVVVSH